MNDLSKYNIKEDVYKCSKCGLCKSVCPLYILTKNEMYLPRGRFIILNNLFKNNSLPKKELIRNFDFCLNCNLCKQFCPSNIDTVRILTGLKNKYNSKYLCFKFSDFYFIYLHFIRILKKLYFIYPFKNNYLSYLFDEKVKRKHYKCEKFETVMLFGGCFNNYINSSDKNAAANIIEKLGYSVKYIDKCCGYPYFSEGNTEKFYNNIKNIIDLVEKNNYKYLICTCDTCYNSLKKIPEFVKNSEKIANKIITFDKFLQINNYNNNNSESIKYFKPLLREEKLPVENIEVINKKSTCSLMENFLLLKYFKNVEKYLNLIYNSLDINNKTILTTCNLTKFGIIKGLTKLNSMSEVLSYSEFIELEEMKKKNID